MAIIDKRRKCFLWFPIRFSKYELNKNFSDELELIVTTGLIVRRIDKIKLFKINDISYKRTVGNFFCGVATVTVHSSDSSAPTQELIKIKRAKKFMEILERNIAEERTRMKIAYRETNII